MKTRKAKDAEPRESCAVPWCRVSRAENGRDMVEAGGLVLCLLSCYLGCVSASCDGMLACFSMEQREFDAACYVTSHSRRKAAL